MSPSAVLFVSTALIIILRIVGLFLGYLVIRMGYNLMVSGIKGEFKFSAKFGGIKADLASVSPGLFFVLLGIFIMWISFSVQKSVEIESLGKYMEKPNITIPKGSPYNDKMTK